MTRALAGACSNSSTPVTLFARKGADCLGKFAGEAERTLRLLFDEVPASALPITTTIIFKTLSSQGLGACGESLSTPGRLVLSDLIRAIPTPQIFNPKYSSYLVPFALSLIRCQLLLCLYLHSKPLFSKQLFCGALRLVFDAVAAYSLPISTPQTLEPKYSSFLGPFAFSLMKCQLSFAYTYTSDLQP